VTASLILKLIQRPYFPILVEARDVAEAMGSTARRSKADDFRGLYNQLRDPAGISWRLREMRNKTSFTYQRISVESTKFIILVTSVAITTL